MKSSRPVDLSCIHSDTRLEAAHKALFRPLPDAVIPFGDMILVKFMRRSENASDECFGIGLPQEESEHRLFRELAEAIHAAADVRHGAATEHAKARVCGWAIGQWMRSHHRN